MALTPPGAFEPATNVPPIADPSQVSEPLSWLQVPSSEVNPEFAAPALAMLPSRRYVQPPDGSSNNCSRGGRRTPGVDFGSGWLMTVYRVVSAAVLGPPAGLFVLLTVPLAAMQICRV